MNKARKRRRSRRERDLRWIARGGGKEPITPGTHRYKKLFGVPKKGNKSSAFWCPETEREPFIVQLHAKVLTCDVFAFPGA